MTAGYNTLPAGDGHHLGAGDPAGWEQRPEKNALIDTTNFLCVMPQPAPAGALAARLTEIFALGGFADADVYVAMVPPGATLDWPDWAEPDPTVELVDGALAHAKIPPGGFIHCLYPPQPHR